MNTKLRKPGDISEESASRPNGHADETLTGLNSFLLKAIDRNRAIAQHLMHTMQEESLRFVNLRLERTSQALEKGRECQGVSDLITLQHNWLLDVARDYAELNKRFGEVLQEMAAHGVEGPATTAQDAAPLHPQQAGGERVAA